jgi:RHS repeat-associated protein
MQARRLIRLVILAALCALARPAFAGEYVLFYHNDATGSPVAMTDINGNVVWRADYEPFGNLAAVTETLPNTHEFIGKERDQETSLHYFGARYYDVRIGRFLSVDPALLRGRPPSAKTIPQRLNLYSYSTNNPYRYFDPDGKYTIVIQGFSSFGISNLSGRPGVEVLSGRLRDAGERTDLVQHDTNLNDFISNIRAASEGGEPINLVGHSLGGVTAKEWARQLEEMGIVVNYLGTIDTYGNPNISSNVRKNKNFMQKGFLWGFPNQKEDPASQTEVENLERSKSHIGIVEEVTPEIVKDITGKVIDFR